MYRLQVIFITAWRWGSRVQG